MAYSNGGGIGRSLLRTLTGTLNFSGRARRLDVIYWWLTATLLAPFVAAIVVLLFPAEEIQPAALVMVIVLIVPSIALSARRLHDQGRSGGMTLLLAVPPVLQSVNAVSLGRPAYSFLITDLPLPAQLYWLAKAFSIGWITLQLLPGTKGPNRFGDDPRDSC